nr:uncharacterized protein LOC111999267 isoform X4 [Quercus suber]POE67745.1 hypothetical protein CFP56_13888 [Quercus suber]
MMGPQQSLKRKSNQTPPLLESITQSESFSGSKGDDGTATELEEKIKSDTATVGKLLIKSGQLFLGAAKVENENSGNV